VYFIFWTVFFALFKTKQKNKIFFALFLFVLLFLQLRHK
jgi:hypothetical protein